jgi:hypothetical protein
MLSDVLRREHPKAAGVPIAGNNFAKGGIPARFTLCGLDGKLVQVW